MRGCLICILSRKKVEEYFFGPSLCWNEERGWHSRLVRGHGARGPEFDSRISHPCFDFFPFRVAK